MHCLILALVTIFGFNSRYRLLVDARYTAPTALMMTVLLSVQLGSRQMPTEVLWQAVLGVTYHYTSGHIPEDMYSEYCEALKVGIFSSLVHNSVIVIIKHDLQRQFGDALRTGTDRNQYAVRLEDAAQPSAITVGGGAGSSAALMGNDDGDMTLVPGSETGQVEEASEYRFFLYRHWSLYDAMFHSPYIASKLRAWNQQGTATFQVWYPVSVVLL